MSSTRPIMLAGCAALLAIFSACSKQPEQAGGARLPNPGPDREYSVEWPPLKGGADRYGPDRGGGQRALGAPSGAVQ